MQVYRLFGDEHKMPVLLAKDAGRADDCRLLERVKLILVISAFSKTDRLGFGFCGRAIEHQWTARSSHRITLVSGCVLPLRYALLRAVEAMYHM